MNELLKPGTIMKLDTTGLFYSTIATESHPGTFGVSVYLNEDVDFDALTKAVKRLYDRLPHYNVAIIHDENQNKNIELEGEVLPEYDSHPEVFCKYFPEGERTSRVLYGKNYFTMEVLHSVCDGGTLTKAVKALTIEYFNQLGVKTPYQEINLDEEFSMDEIENAVVKYAKKPQRRSLAGPEPYHQKATHITSRRMNYLFQCSEIKAKAKALGVTITEYIISRMVLSTDKERKALGDTSPIVVNIPLDCRRFYPTKTLRNFVIAFNVVIDTYGSEEDLLSQIHNQMSTIDQEYVQNYLDNYSLAGYLVSPISYEETRKNFERIENITGGKGMTTIISNVGLVRFDPLIQPRIHHMDFTLCPEGNCPYQYSAVTCGDYLSITVAVGIKETEVLEDTMNLLRK